MIISIEGMDGTGKSTLATNLHQYITLNHDQKASLYPCPGATLLGQEIRKLVKNRQDLKIHKTTAQMLMAADFYQFIEEIRESTHTIITDRNNLISGLAYGLASGMPFEDIQSIYKTITKNCPKFHVIILKAPIQAIADRQHGDLIKNGDKIQEVECNFQKLGNKFQEGVVKEYDHICKILSGSNKDVVGIDREIFDYLSFIQSFWILDASKDIPTILQEAIGIIDVLFASPVPYDRPMWLP